MGMTITEKILAAHTGVKKVAPGEIVNCKADILLGNDITAPISIDLFEKSGAKRVFDCEKIVFVPDHFAPNKDIESATQCKKLREFSLKHKILNYFEVGRMGIEHALLPENGIVLPGDLVIGADSHTCTYGALGAFSTGIGSTDLAAAMINGKIWLKVPSTIKLIFFGKLNKWVSGKDLILYTIGKIGVNGANYKAMEFCGEVIKNLNMDNRFTICNMAIEAGAKNGIIEPDKETLRYIKKRAHRKHKLYKSDRDAKYEEILEFNCNRIEPQIAFPHSPENAKPISQVGDIGIDQVVIGSCTNGRITDLIEAAKILKGKKVNSNVRLLIFPATQAVYKEALKKGLIDIFIDAEAVVSTPTCGPCLGGHMGVLAEGERAIATTNRNFVGRMGHSKSEIYLASPAVAAASAVKGRIASPEEVVKG